MKSAQTTPNTHMAPLEKELFLNCLAGVRCYYEFGVGGSTIAAWQAAHPTIYGVDSSLEWIKIVTGTISNPAVVIEHVDLGALGNWGMPISKKPSETIWKRYSAAIERVPDPKAIDLVLVDGRFRVACFLRALLSGSNAVKILVHDYTRRRGYHVMEKFARKTMVAKSLVLFEKFDYSADDLTAIRDAYSVYWKILL